MLPSTKLYQSSGSEKRKTGEYMGGLLFDRHNNEYELTRGKFLSTTMVILRQAIVNKPTLRGLCDVGSNKGILNK
jgi:hypothetical protein